MAIVGLTRCGSTLLDLALGTQPGIVGLGEIATVLRPDTAGIPRTASCTCGKVETQCNFWAPMRSLLDRHASADADEKYRLCLRMFQDQFGAGTVLVDSSKSIRSVQILKQIEHVDLRVILLVRDVRAWIVSRLDDRAGNPAKFSTDGVYVRNLHYHFGRTASAVAWMIPWLTRSPLYYGCLWHLQQWRLLRRLQALGVSGYLASYEMFTRAPEQEMRRILSFIGVDQGAGINLSASRSHIIAGNPNRDAPGRREHISYDDRWQGRSDWRLPFVLPWVRKMNQQLVYENHGQLLDS
ncbi:MAG: hypothetical protein A3H91_02890 [Gammaproteobacteria bacterium RIFCSPLOWO2_02_FULL_61_13]|nr:MAG: hypothetical protein A3H91_02890 [Gammaproteobacteria bacterium RIFCSPLOWO2_02_FULL_61_13]